MCPSSSVVPPLNFVRVMIELDLLLPFQRKAPRVRWLKDFPGTSVLMTFSVASVEDMMNDNGFILLFYLKT